MYREKGWMITLGYYDNEENSSRQQNRKKGGFFLSSFIGAIVGALAILLAVPTLSNYGLLPYSVEPSNQVSVEEKEMIRNKIHYPKRLRRCGNRYNKGS